MNSLDQPLSRDLVLHGLAAARISLDGQLAEELSYAEIIGTVARKGGARAVGAFIDAVGPLPSTLSISDMNAYPRRICYPGNVDIWGMVHLDVLIADTVTVHGKLHLGDLGYARTIGGMAVVVQGQLIAGDITLSRVEGIGHVEANAAVCNEISVRSMCVRQVRASELIADRVRVGDGYARTARIGELVHEGALTTGLAYIGSMIHEAFAPELAATA